MNFTTIGTNASKTDTSELVLINTSTERTNATRNKTSEFHVYVDLNDVNFDDVDTKSLFSLDIAEPRGAINQISNHLNFGILRALVSVTKSDKTLLIDPERLASIWRGELGYQEESLMPAIIYKASSYTVVVVALDLIEKCWYLTNAFIDFNVGRSSSKYSFSLFERDSRKTNFYGHKVLIEGDENFEDDELQKVKEILLLYPDKKSSDTKELHQHLEGSFAYVFGNSINPYLEDPFLDKYENYLEDDPIEFYCGSEESLEHLTELAVKVFWHHIINISGRDPEIYITVTYVADTFNNSVGLNIGPSRCTGKVVNQLEMLLKVISDANEFGGTSVTYNDGAYDRVSGYSKDNATIFYSFEGNAGEFSAFEVVDAYKELSEWLTKQVAADQIHLYLPQETE